jgi:pyruvate formate lyase activating enzyme
MKEALLYEPSGGKRVHCLACAHSCVIAPGNRGLCAVRQNVDGRLVTLTYGRLIARDVDPIEKKPLFHFYPGTRAYSIATVGCNFTCLNCQNHFISQYAKEHNGRLIGDAVGPEAVVEDALRADCRSIAYTYTEPTIAVEFVLDVMRRARAQGLANVWVSNGYFSHETALEVLPWLDGINIDLKGISDEFYHAVCGGNVRPVLDSIERAHEAGVWTEVTTLVIPGWNDSDEELRWTAEAISGIAPSIPWHLSRFFPAYRMVDRPPTPVETLERARGIGRDAGLVYVYIGNVLGEGEETRCPDCGTKVILRAGYHIREDRLRDGACPSCGRAMEGIWESAP